MRVGTTWRTDSAVHAQLDPLSILLSTRHRLGINPFAPASSADRESGQLEQTSESLRVVGAPAGAEMMARSDGAIHQPWNNCASICVTDTPITPSENCMYPHASQRTIKILLTRMTIFRCFDQPISTSYVEISLGLFIQMGQKL